MTKKNDCKYGKVAIKAANFATIGKMDPKKAWKEACNEVWPDMTKNKSCRIKGCPRNAFLGLCEAGMIKKLKKGDYTFKNKNYNKDYAIKAVKILRKNSELSDDKNKLWKKVIDKKPNDQMDVVLALWNEELIVDCCTN